MNKNQAILFGLSVTFTVFTSINGLSQTIPRPSTINNPNATMTMIANEIEARNAEMAKLEEDYKIKKGRADAAFKKQKADHELARAEYNKLKNKLQAYLDGKVKLSDQEVKDIMAQMEKYEKICKDAEKVIDAADKQIDILVDILNTKSDTLKRLGANYEKLSTKIQTEINILTDQLQQEIDKKNARDLGEQFNKDMDKIESYEEMLRLVKKYLDIAKKR